LMLKMTCRQPADKKARKYSLGIDPGLFFSKIKRLLLFMTLTIKPDVRYDKKLF